MAKDQEMWRSVTHLHLAYMVTIDPIPWKERVRKRMLT